jgi:hypothetical protein
MGIGDLIHRLLGKSPSVEREEQEEEKHASRWQRDVDAQELEGKKADALIAQLQGTPSDSFESDEQA